MCIFSYHVDVVDRVSSAVKHLDLVVLCKQTGPQRRVNGISKIVR